MVNCIIVDDEPMAQKVIENHISRLADLSLACCCSNAMEAFNAINSADVDLMFLDIKMPALNGIDFINSLKNPPSVIFTTSYSEFAVVSYDLGAIDYLMKPVTFERFEKSIHKYFKQAMPEEKAPTYSYFKVDGRLPKIEHLDILYAQSIRDYLIIYTVGRHFITHMTMKYLSELLPVDLFVRVHRSFLIGIQHLKSIGTHELKVGEVTIPMGDKYKSELLSVRQRLNPVTPVKQGNSH